MNTYGNYVCIPPEEASDKRIAQEEERMRQEALEFLKRMDQPIERMDDVKIIVKRWKMDKKFSSGVTVGWRVDV